MRERAREREREREREKERELFMTTEANDNNDGEEVILVTKAPRLIVSL